jgi:hypothetical protein
MEGLSDLAAAGARCCASLAGAGVGWRTSGGRTVADDQIGW